MQEGQEHHHQNQQIINQQLPHTFNELEMITPTVHINHNKILGQGSTGTIYEGVNHSPGAHPVAIKVIPLSQINNQVVGYLLQCQLQALKMTSHIYSNDKTQMKPNFNNNSIVQLQDIVVLNGNCYIIMELLAGGTLKNHLSKCKKLPQQESVEILKRILEGYKILKDCGIVHRDLKPQNIIFQQQIQKQNLQNQQMPNQHEHSSRILKSDPKIIDFGYCQVQKLALMKPKVFYNVGSPRYMSPQAYMQNKYSQKSDIWAIGIIFYEMVTGTNFDKGQQIEQSFKNIKERGIPIPASLSPRSRRFLQNMLMYDARKRASCQQILRDIYWNEEQNQKENIQVSNRKISGASNPNSQNLQFLSNLPNANLRNTYMTPKNASSKHQPNEHQDNREPPSYLRHSIGLANLQNYQNQYLSASSVPIQQRTRTPQMQRQQERSTSIDMRRLVRSGIHRNNQNVIKSPREALLYSTNGFMGNTESKFKDLSKRVNYPFQKQDQITKMRKTIWENKASNRNLKKDEKNVEMPQFLKNQLIMINSRYMNQVQPEEKAGQPVQPNLNNSSSKSNLAQSNYNSFSSVTNGQRRVNIMFRAPEHFNNNNNNQEMRHRSPNSNMQNINNMNSKLNSGNIGNMSTNSTSNSMINHQNQSSNINNNNNGNVQRDRIITRVINNVNFNNSTNNINSNGMSQMAKSVQHPHIMFNGHEMFVNSDIRINNNQQQFQQQQVNHQAQQQVNQPQVNHQQHMQPLQPLQQQMQYPALTQQQHNSRKVLGKSPIHTQQPQLVRRPDVHFSHFVQN